VIACLRSARFWYPDRSAEVFVELRRHHDTDSRTVGNKTFIVTQRAGQSVTVKRWGSIAEARVDWLQRVHRLEDLGLKREDIPISGFHEEG